MPSAVTPRIIAPSAHQCHHPDPLPDHYGWSAALQLTSSGSNNADRCSRIDL